MSNPPITEEMIFECFAAAQLDHDPARTAASFVDVEEYENQIMYPEFARWAERAGNARLATLFRKVAGEEKLHAVWLRELYSDMGTPARGADTQRAIDALETIQANCDTLFEANPEAVLEKALAVAMRVEQREFADIYPHFRDQAANDGDHRAAAVYQRVIDSERQHFEWFRAAATELAAA